MGQQSKYVIAVIVIYAVKDRLFVAVAAPGRAWSGSRVTRC